jgi:hypothetical protein
MFGLSDLLLVARLLTRFLFLPAVLLFSTAVIGHGQSLLWAKRAGGLGVDGAFIAVDGAGNSYITGGFALGLVNGTATFGPGETNQTVLTSDGNNDIRDGVRVARDSFADVANYLIDLSTGTGVAVLENTGVNLGEDSGSTIFTLPNSSTNNNGDFAYRCNSGSTIGGRLGTLSGSLGGPTTAAWTIWCRNFAKPKFAFRESSLVFAIGGSS